MRNAFRAFRALFLACLPLVISVSVHASSLDDTVIKTNRFIENHPCSQPENISNTECLARIGNIRSAQDGLRVLVDGSVRGSALRKQVNVFRSALLALKSYRPPKVGKTDVGSIVPEPPTDAANAFPYRITRYADFFEGRKTSLGDTFTQGGYSMALCGPELGYVGYVVPKQWNKILVKLNDRPSCVKNPDILDLPTRAYRDVFSGNPREIEGNFVPLFKQSKYQKTPWTIGGVTYPNTYFVGELADFTQLPSEYSKIAWTFPDGRVSEMLNDSPDTAWQHSWYFDSEGKYQAKAIDRNGNTVAEFEFWAFPFSKFAPVLFWEAEIPVRNADDSTFLIDKVRIDERHLWYRFRAAPSEDHWFVSIGNGPDARTYVGKDGAFVPLESLAFPPWGEGVPFKAFRAVSPTGFSHDAKRAEAFDRAGVLRMDSASDIYIADK